MRRQRFTLDQRLRASSLMQDNSVLLRRTQAVIETPKGLPIEKLHAHGLCIDRFLAGVIVGLFISASIIIFCNSILGHFF